MRLARIYDLKPAGGSGDFLQSRKIGKQQVGAFVRRGSSRETERQNRGLHHDTSRALYLGHETFLGLPVRRLNERQRDAERVTQAVVVLPPVGDVAVEQFLERLARPRGRVNAVRDGIDHVAREHELRYLAMKARDPIMIVTEVECEVTEVEDAVATEDFAVLVKIVQPEDTTHEIERKFVVAGGHRRVRREDTTLANEFDILAREAAAAVRGGALVEQLEA